MRRILLFLVLLCGWSLQLIVAQPYLEKASQHRFARGYIGLNTQYQPNSGTMFIDEVPQSFPTQVVPRITLGGVHFWGRLDFSMSLSLARFTHSQLSESTSIVYQTGGDFSARYYPWQIKEHRLRPYIGGGLQYIVLGLQHEDLGSRYDFLPSFSGVGGFSYALGDWQLNADVTWLPFTETHFYTNRTQQETFRLPSLYYSLGLVRYFDSTIKKEREKESGQWDFIVSELEPRNRLNTFTLGLAPTTAFFFENPTYQSAERQSVPNHKAVMTMEVGLGYQWHKPGIHVGMSYRNYQSTRKSYGLEHAIRRRAITVEAYKFLLDYNGFVPFIGPSLSWDRWSTGEFENGELIGSVQRTEKLTPGIIFGWDIVASPYETWLLRTNLRYYPLVEITDIEGKKSRVDQFEFNFIQVVLFPNRLWHVTKRKK